MLREFFQEQLRDQGLGAAIDLELDVVRLRGIHPERSLKTMAQHFAGAASRFHRCVEVMRHDGETLIQKKTGRRNESFSRVEVIGWNYEKPP
jgi:hypothetical protein